MAVEIHLSLDVIKVLLLLYITDLDFLLLIRWQTSYPRTACVRKAWVARQLIKLIIFTGFMGFIVEQVTILGL